MLGGTLIVEKKSNLLGSGASWVSVCFWGQAGLLTVISSPKLFDLCKRRKESRSVTSVFRWLLAENCEKGMMIKMVEHCIVTTVLNVWGTM